MGQHSLFWIEQERHNPPRGHGVHVSMHQHTRMQRHTYCALSQPCVCTHHTGTNDDCEANFNLHFQKNCKKTRSVYKTPIDMRMR